jgi:uncharacterized membrane protein YfcA
VSPLEVVAVLLAGLWAGTINTVVGSGTLITFPVLLAVGISPVTANVSNAIGLVPGSIAGAFGYRRELAGQRDRTVRLLIASFIGALLGAALLLVLPPNAFEAIVPVLILLAVVLVVLQPRLSRAVMNRRAARRAAGGAVPDDTHGAWWVWPSVLLTGVYGGYFSAAQGVLLMAVLGIGVNDSLQRLNAVKNVLAACVNIVSGVVFVIVVELVPSGSALGTDAEIDWLVALLIGLGTFVGGFIGASVGRRLPQVVLRAVIVVVALVAVTTMLLA